MIIREKIGQQALLEELAIKTGGVREEKLSIESLELEIT